MNNIELLIQLIRVRLSYGQTIQEIQAAFESLVSNDLICFAYKAAEILNQGAEDDNR